MLTEKEQLAVRCYEGDVPDSGDAFWSDRKMYCTWNALLFAGLSTEEARTAEDRVLNPAFLADDTRILELTRDLIRALRKMPKDGRPVTAYRVERLADYRVMKETGYLPSFISTSLSGFLDSYRDKKQLVLMQFTIAPEALYGSLGALLERYEKAEEAEVLLAPYQRMEITEKQMPAKLRAITDADGRAPAVYCEVYISGAACPRRTMHAQAGPDRQSLYRVYEALNAHRTPAAADVQNYLRWKEAFQSSVLEILTEEGL